MADQMDGAMGDTFPQTPTANGTDRAQATQELMASFMQPRSRRGLLKGAMIGATGAALASAGILTALPAQAHAASESAVDILSVARTAEQLAVTFYSHGIQNHKTLGIVGNELAYLKAAVVEEQIHLNFLVAHGGKSLADTFSFPHGAATFTSKHQFIETLGVLENDFIAAYLAAVKEFAEMGSPSLAQIAAQIMGVEAEHRTLGRDIGGLVPADNVAFEVAGLATVGAAVDALKAQGFLSPRKNNTYTYAAVSNAGAGVTHRNP